MTWLRAPRVMRLVRRAHMYAGLVMCPWILFYGLSGIYFNHPNVGEKVSGRFLPPPALAAQAGFQPWRPQTVAGEVVGALNAAAGSEAYRLDPEFTSRFAGVAVLKAPSPDGMHVLLLDLERGAGVLARRWARPAGPELPFAGSSLGLPYTTAALEASFAGLLAKQGLPAAHPLRADPRLIPKLELRLLDREGVRWDVHYDPGEGKVTGRRSDRWPGLGLSQLSAMLHTTHHFPFKIEARWFWALFQDLLGVIMVFWAVSGLFMWWQLKATRLAGLVSMAAALAIAAAVFYTTTRDITFGRVAQTLAPGD